jgi:CheY-like chemotaxis protein
MDTTTAPVVLTVGETALLRLPLAALLRRNGYHPLEAGLGAEARARAAEGPSAGALLALTRGDADELTTLRALAAHTRVAVVTPHATEALVRAALQTGAAQVVSQPAPERRLVQAIQHVVAPPRRRVSERVAAMLPALLALPEGRAAASPCIIEDVSLSGARCWVRDPAVLAVLGPGMVGALTIALPGGTRIRPVCRVVRVIADDVVGVAFLHLTELERRYLERYYTRAQAKLDRSVVAA